jgi:hypothetical protein
MGDSTFGKSASVYVSVKPEHIVAATMPVYRNEKLELYKNSDIAPNGCLYIETPHGDTILRQPTLQEANPDQYTLFLRKTDATGHVLLPATRDNTAVYMTGVRDYAEAKSLMAKFEDHAERIRRAHENEALQASFFEANKEASAVPAETAPAGERARPRQHLYPANRKP